MSLTDERYIKLETFKKDGQPAATPVWIASADGELVVITDADSFKAKRLRRDSRIRVTACNVNGKRTHGPTLEGTAEVVQEPGFVQRVSDAIEAKYGWQARLIRWVKRLRRQQDTTCALRLQLQ